MAADAKEMLGRLVGFDTVSAKSNLALIDYVAGYLSDLGIESVRVENDEGDKANLLATIGPVDAPGGVVLSGHTDVVPVDGQDWATDPFGMDEKDGRLYGRGTCDMKGFIAAALALAPEFLARDLKRPIHFAFTYDEEVGCLGAPRLIETIGKRLPPCHAVIVGEPTSMRAVGAHRDVNVFRTTVKGRPSHASQPGEGADAIAAAARLMAFLADRADELVADPSPVEAAFDPPHANLNVGIVEGGKAVNIIAASCAFSWGCRSATGIAEEMRAALDDYAETEVLPKLRATAPEASIVTEYERGIPPLEMDENSAAAALARELTGQNELGSVAFGAEAGLYARAGIPAVLLGPGSIRQAHTANEFLEISQLDECVDFLTRLGAWCAR